MHDAVKHRMRAIEVIETERKLARPSESVIIACEIVLRMTENAGTTMAVWSDPEKTTGGI
jgi:hypothetical protein